MILFIFASAQCLTVTNHLSLQTQGPQQKLTNTSAILPKPVRKMLRSSVTSSSSSGFEEALESPTSLSAMPLLGTANTGSSDQGFSEGFSIMVCS